MSLATAGIILASLTSVVAAGAPAQAVARCTSDGKPKATSGKFKNRAGHTMMVKGDALVNGRFKTVERLVRKEGGTAWEAGVCDVDFIKTYADFISNNVVYDGDEYKKITGSWECWQFAVRPGTPVSMECG